MTLEEIAAGLTAWRDQRADIERVEGAVMFMGKPDHWFDDPHWFCINGHVSGNYLSGDSGARCLACREPVILGPKIGETQFAPVANALRSHLKGTGDE